MGIILALLKAVGTWPDVIESFIMEVMSWIRPWEMVWSIVKGMRSSGQVVGLLDEIICSFSSVERGENVIRKEEGKGDREVQETIYS